MWSAVSSTNPYSPHIVSPLYIPSCYESAPLDHSDSPEFPFRINTVLPSPPEETSLHVMYMRIPTPSLLTLSPRSPIDGRPDQTRRYLHYFWVLTEGRLSLLLLFSLCAFSSSCYNACVHFY